MSARPTTGCLHIGLSFLFALLPACHDPQPDPVPPVSKNVRLGMKQYDQASYTYQSHDLLSLARQLSDRHEDPDTAMALLDIQPGWTVADIGCGMGFYTFRFARAVGPEGKVFALDIVEKAVDLVKLQSRREDKNPWANIQVLHTRVDSTLLPDDTLDLGFMSHMGWYVPSRLLPENIRMIADTYRIIKPGGLLVVLQHRATADDKSYTQTNFEAVGFHLEQHRFLEYGSSDMYFFRKSP